MGAESPREPTTRRAASAPALPPHQWTRVDDPAMERVVASGETVIAGGGPAGLTAAYELTKHGHRCVVLEANPDRVGGISRTDVYKGYRFDIGGHRFFSKSEEVNRLWREILGDEFLVRPRMSRIYYDQKFFDYPLRPMDALWKLGPIRSAMILASYVKARLVPIKPERSFEDWVVNRFGRILFETFFKTYTEKVWGIPTNKLSADWAAQRIKGLSLVRAVLSALTGKKKGGEVIKTLIDQFHYPRLGPGQMWEAASAKVKTQGGVVAMGQKVASVEHNGSSVEAFIAVDPQGRRTRYEGKHFLSTMPIRQLIRSMSPAAPAEVREAAEGLGYRDFLSVVLIVDRAETFPDTWLYIHDPGVKVGRIQIFKNWSPDLVPDPSKSSLGLEYFCFEGDDLWTMPDDQLIELGKREIDRIGLVKGTEVIDGCVVRMPKAYPVYDDDYKQRVAIIRDWLSGLGNLSLSGRNGMHKYNNQDHSMMTALLVARNILGGGPYDPWKVNTDAEYHEQGEEGAEEKGRSVPRALAAG